MRPSLLKVSKTIVLIWLILMNLSFTFAGKLFHIDFGYILGRDPKPFPPPMKLSKEMVRTYSL